MSRTVSLTLCTAAVAVLATVTAACGSSAGNGGSSTTGSADPSAIPAGTVLNVGDQEQIIETLLQDSGQLKGVPYQVNFVQFASGPLVDSGFAAGRIDIGFMGDLPASLAVESGLHVKAVAVDTGVGADEFLIAEPGIKSIAQLKGKTVAYTTGTAEQAFALRALATAHLRQSDVQQVDVTLEQLFTVLEAGQVDASVVTGVQEERLYLQQHPTAKVLASNTTVTPPSYDYELATTSALAQAGKSAAIWDFVRRLIKASNWAVTHKQLFATDYLVDIQHEPPAEAKLSVTGGLIGNWKPLGPSVQAALQNVVQLETEAGALKQSFSVAPLFSASAAAKYNAILKEVPQP